MGVLLGSPSGVTNPVAKLDKEPGWLVRVAPGWLVGVASA
jgi:hypothetical protein